VCKHTFKVGPTGSANVAASSDGVHGGNGQNASEDSSMGFATLESQHRILSAADEAMLREFGSGSGLLELTREAFDVQASERARSHPLAAAPSPDEMSDRQFQIVGTALTMANRLVTVYKGELARTRRISLIA